MHAQILNRGLEEGKAVLYSHDTAKANLESMSIARELEGLSDSQVIPNVYVFTVTVYTIMSRTMGKDQKKNVMRF